jgi:hypothetical protein
MMVVKVVVMVVMVVVMVVKVVIIACLSMDRQTNGLSCLSVFECDAI